MRAAGAESHYEVLGVARRATAEQIEKAYQFMREMYEDVALATYTLLDPEEMRTARARVNQAFEVLGDPHRRKEYDDTLDAPARERAVLPFAPAPVAAGGIHVADVALPEPVNGAALRAVRLGRGVTLTDISATSKVGVRFLDYIESDRHELLPARVYLRSFLIEYAKALGLEPARTADAYLAHVTKGEK